MTTPKTDISIIHSIERSTISLTAACDMMQLLEEHLENEVVGMKESPVKGVTENIVSRIELSLSQIMGIQKMLCSGLADLQNLVEDT